MHSLFSRIKKKKNSETPITKERNNFQFSQIFWNKGGRELPEGIGCIIMQVSTSCLAQKCDTSFGSNCNHPYWVHIQLNLPNNPLFPNVNQLTVYWSYILKRTRLDKTFVTRHDKRIITEIEIICHKTRQKDNNRNWNESVLIAPLP